MLLIIAETTPANGLFSLQNAFLIASITCNKKDVSFIVYNSRDVSSFFIGKGFNFSVNTGPRKIFKEDISLVLFFKDKLSGKDKKILTLARKRGIPTAKLSYMGGNPEDTDIVIDPSITSYISSKDEKKILSGPEYSILNNKYIHFHSVKKKYNKKLRNILLAPGDEFPYKELRKLTESLINKDYKVKIVPGKNFKRFNRKTLKRIYPSLSISGTPESYARSYFEADLAIIDPEFSAVRASATGTPAIYMPQNKHGDMTASYYEEKGAGVIFKRWKKEDYSEMIELLKFFSPEKREKMGNTAKTLVDGKGVYRISEVLKNFLNS